MPSFVTDCVESSLNTRMVWSDGTKELVTTVNSNGAALQIPLLRSYSTKILRLLKRYTNDETIAEADAAILCITQSSDMKWLH